MERLREGMLDQELFRWEPGVRALQYLEKFNKRHVTGELEAAKRFLQRYGHAGIRAINEVRATEETCTRDHRYLCRHYRALGEAERADVIIANHHLALLWPDSYPTVDRIVIDEAHTLEETATDVFGAAYSASMLHFRLRRLYSAGRGVQKGILDKLPYRDFVEFEANRVVDRIDRVKTTVSHMEASITDFLEERKNKPARVRDDELTPAWLNLCEAAEHVAVTVRRMARQLEQLADELATVERLTIPAEKLARSSEGFTAIRSSLEAIFQPTPVAETVLWLEHRNERPIFRRAPIELGATFRTSLYSRYRSVTLTSATLQTGGSFDFLANRLGLSPEESPDSEENSFLPRILDPVSVGHPFDYAEKTLLCLREPGDDDPALFIEHLAQITHGRMLALYTNNARMLSAAEQLKSPDLSVLVQHRDGGRHDLVRSLIKNPDTVLFGTRSFWEGVDVPGEDLSIVVLEKVPFLPPDDPVYSARCEALGDKWFHKYALPLALLTLRQGFGRLIRTEKDRGVVVICNPGKKGYRKALLKSLPECPTVTGDDEAILKVVEEFFR